MKNPRLVLTSLLFATLTALSAVAADTESQVIQVVIDCPKIEVYLHPEISGRIPLRIAGVIPDGLRVTKYGKNIVKVISGDSDAKAVIVVDKLSVADTEATVCIRIPAEGVSASFTLKKASDAWSISSSKVVER